MKLKYNNGGYPGYMMDDQPMWFGKYKGKLVSWIVENDYPYSEWLLTVVGKQARRFIKSKQREVIGVVKAVKI